MAEAALKRSWLSRLNFKSNWPVVATFLALAFTVVALWDSGSWAKFEPQQGQSISFPLLYFRYSFSRYLPPLIGLLSILSLVGLAFSFWKKQPVAAVLLVADLYLGVVGFCGLVGYWFGGTSLQNLDTISFSGHVYHLFYYHSWSGDNGEMDFVVYECDEVNIECSIVNMIRDTPYRMIGGTQRPGRFVVDSTDGTLYIELVSSDFTQRLPATG